MGWWMAAGCGLLAPPGQDEATKAELAQLRAQLVASETRIAALEQQLGWVASMSSKVALDGAGDVVFTGTNIVLQSGRGATDGFPADASDGSDPGVVDGKGNLVIGYGHSVAGSHNLVVGTAVQAVSYGAICAGSHSRCSAPYATVLGGELGAATGRGSVVVMGGVDGQPNTAEGPGTVVLGGRGNTVRPKGTVVAVGPVPENPLDLTFYP
jgi:hypothetical protein